MVEVDGSGPEPAVLDKDSVENVALVAKVILFRSEENSRERGECQRDGVDCENCRTVLEGRD